METFGNRGVRSKQKTPNLKQPRVLLADDELASRLTLQTLLRAGGYSVDAAASGPEALAKLDSREYDLVLSGLTVEPRETGRKVLAYARTKDYRPATAVVTSYQSSKPRSYASRASQEQQQVFVESQDVSGLLSKVADLVARRATKRSARVLRDKTAAGC
jgi:CheY-like chemotaxis protein